MSKPTDSQVDPRELPSGVAATLRNLGPGAIVAAAVIGSSTLIATTNIAVKTGYWLLWFVVLGCVFKVFLQVELGRYCVGHGKTTLAALNDLPGPRVRVRWTLWLWLVMFVASLGQLGGIVGGVGQCLALTFPLTGDFAERVEIGCEQAKFDRGLRELDEQQFLVGDNLIGPTAAELRAAYRAIGSRPFGARSVVPERLEFTWDDVIWAAVATLLAIVLLCGRYLFIERMCFVLVCMVVLIAIVNLIALLFNKQFAVAANFGQSFHLRWSPLGESFTALAVLSICGLGAAELIFYPYWCLEKGYARQIGSHDETEAWANRARSWFGVMRWDAFVAMLLYMLLTVVFYLLGTAMFLCVAAVAVFTAFYAITASNARVAADAVDLFRKDPRKDSKYDRSVKLFSWLLPLLAFGMYVVSKEPVRLLLIGGLMQAIMLLVLAWAAVYFRYRCCDTRLMPGKLWDVALWCSLLTIFVSGAYLAISQGSKLVDQIVTTINW